MANGPFRSWPMYPHISGPCCWHVSCFLHCWHDPCFLLLVCFLLAWSWAIAPGTILARFLWPRPPPGRPPAPARRTPPRPAGPHRRGIAAGHRPGRRAGASTDVTGMGLALAKTVPCKRLLRLKPPEDAALAGRHCPCPRTRSPVHLWPDHIRVQEKGREISSVACACGTILAKAKAVPAVGSQRQAHDASIDER